MATVDGTHVCVQLETDRWVGVGVLGWGGHQQLGRFRERWPRGLGPWRRLIIGVRDQLCGRQERQTRPHPSWPRGQKRRLWSRTIHKDTSE